MLKVGAALLFGITSTLTSALLPIVTTVLCCDLRVADEGLDLDLRAAIGESTTA